MYNNASPMTVVGNLTREPKLTTVNGKQVCFLTVAVNPWPRQNATPGTPEPEAHYLDLSVWNNNEQNFAQNVASEYKMGESVVAVITMGHKDVPLFKNGQPVISKNTGQQATTQEVVWNVDEIGHRTAKRPTQAQAQAQQVYTQQPPAYQPQPAQQFAQPAPQAQAQQFAQPAPQAQAQQFAQPAPQAQQTAPPAQNLFGGTGASEPLF